MINEISNSFKARLHDSITTPFFGSFVISWLALNHRYVLVYFSDSPLDIKLTDLDTLLPIMKTNTVFAGLAAFIYIALYPYLADKFLMITLWHKKNIKNTKIKGEELIPISIEEKRELLREQDALIQENDKLLERLSKYEKDNEEVVSKYLQKIDEQEQEYKQKINTLSEKLEATETTMRKIENNFSGTMKSYEDSILSNKIAHEAQISELEQEHNKRMEEQENHYNAQISLRNQEVSELKAKKNKPPYDMEEINIKFNLSEPEIKILYYLFNWNLDEQEKKQFFIDITNVTKVPRSIVRAFYDKLIKDNIIKEEYFHDIDVVSITGYGNKYLLDVFSPIDNFSNRSYDNITF